MGYMRFWIVGKMGLVGSEMCKRLLREGLDFISTSKEEANVLDLTQLRSWAKRTKPQYIVNCAALMRVDDAEKRQKQKAYELNRDAVENLATVAKEQRCRLIHISTDYVFSGEQKTPYAEEDPTSPINHYGKSKCAGEERLFSIYPDAVCVRTASLYGGTKMGLVSGMYRALRFQKSSRAVMDQTSSPTYTKDLVDALFEVRDQTGIFHFVNGGSASRLDLLKELFRLAQHYEAPISCRKIVGITQSMSQRAATRPAHTVLDTTKIAPHLTRPIRPWKEALLEYFREYIW